MCRHLRSRKPHTKPRSTMQKESFVYFADEAPLSGVNLIKIGVSNNPDRRAKQIAIQENGYSEVKWPYDMYGARREPKIVHEIRCSNRELAFALEHDFHRIGKHYGWHEVGEWFYLPIEFVDAVTSITTISIATPHTSWQHIAVCIRHMRCLSDADCAAMGQFDNKWNLNVSEDKQIPAWEETPSLF